MNAPNPEPAHLLLVDDREENLTALEALLRRDDLVLLRARSGPEALELLLEHDVALALVDVMMPEMDGFELAELMRGTARTRLVPIIFLTAGGADSRRRFRGYEAGAVDFLHKPLEPDVLRSKVDVFVELDRRRRELARQRDELDAGARENARLVRELRTLADNTPDILTRFDRRYRHVFVNAAVERATGRPSADFIGRTSRELGMPAELCDRWEEGIRAAFETGRPGSIEFTFESADGPRHYAARLVPEPGPGGEVDYVLGLAQDVTEQKRSEEALRDQDRRKNEFLATLAHELRNPLAPLRTGLEVIRRSVAEAPAARKAREMMERQLAHMVRLIDDLLDVSRISRGAVELKRAPVEIRRVLDHALEASRPLVEAAGHDLTIEADPGPAWVDGDLTRLAQVVSNLVNNAAKYTPRGGRIVLSAAVDDGRAVVRVRDDGIGISAEMLHRVFELFTQVDPLADRAQGGLGIGLALVRTLVELHGGSIEAESPGLGLGSTFTVRLPLVPPPAPSAAPGPRPGAADAAGAPRGPLRVLVVDDNDDGARALAVLLKIAGHATRIALDGRGAVEAARDFRPELIFLDIGLPDLDGYEVCRRLRALPDAAGTLLVALTGWGTDDDKRRAAEAGFDLHLIKPVDPEQIDAVLGRAAEHLGHPTAAPGG